MDQAVSFGGYRFEVETGQPWSGNREVRLTPKAAAVLNVLVTHAGEPVTKEQLFASAIAVLPFVDMSPGPIRTVSAKASRRS
jgi:DNA-binding response OmpR family regulator